MFWGGQASHIPAHVAVVEPGVGHGVEGGGGGEGEEEADEAKDQDDLQQQRVE